MRKVIEIVRCDWCKKETDCKNVFVAEKKCDLCQPCIDELFTRLSEPAVEQPRGRRKKGANEAQEQAQEQIQHPLCAEESIQHPLSSEESAPQGPTRSEYIAAVISELSLDMRQPAIATAFDLAVLDALAAGLEGDPLAAQIKINYEQRIFAKEIAANEEEISF